MKAVFLGEDRPPQGPSLDEPGMSKGDELDCDENWKVCLQLLRGSAREYMMI